MKKILLLILFPFLLQAQWDSDAGGATGAADDSSTLTYTTDSLIAVTGNNVKVFVIDADTLKGECSGCTNIDTSNITDLVGFVTNNAGDGDSTTNTYTTDSLIAVTGNNVKTFVMDADTLKGEGSGITNLDTSNITDLSGFVSNNAPGDSTFDSLFVNNVKTLGEDSIKFTGKTYADTVNAGTYLNIPTVIGTTWIDVPAGSWDLTTTDFAPLDRDVGSNQFVFTHLFDDTTPETLQIQFSIPNAINTSDTVIFQYYHYAATAASGDSTVYAMRHLSIPASGDWDAAGTVDTFPTFDMDATQDNIDIETSKFTYADLTWAASEFVIYRYFREAGAPADDLTGDDRLLLLRIGLTHR